MIKRFADLTYSREDLEQDAIHYLKTQVYEPTYVNQVKEFMVEDLDNFKNYFDDDEYAFHNVYYDEYVIDYREDRDVMVPNIDLKSLTNDLEYDFERLDMNDYEVERYTLMLEAEFRKNAFCSHMEPYFLGYDAVVATVITGYSRDPVFSVYSMVREWAMALHFKKMYPQQMKKFGFRYQSIRENLKGEERLKAMLNFRDKYKLTLQNIGMLRAVHSSIFAYTYLYLRAALSGETEFIEDFILEASSSQIYLLLEGENVKNVDFLMVKWALEELKGGRYKELLTPSAQIDWDAVYDFAYEAIQNAGGMDNLRSMGFDGIAAKTIRSFWNKSANMQKMLKILRRLAMDNNDPIINSLIEMCEYRLGRPNDKSKKKMERFIEQTRKLMAARAYELTRPRTMAQEMIAAFPSVFLVYFQWHHNFRNIYPKVPEKQVYYDRQKQQRQQAESKLVNRIQTEDIQKARVREAMNEQQNKNRYEQETVYRYNLQAENKIKESMREDENKMRLIIQNRENTLRENVDREKKNNQNISLVNIADRNQRQGSL
ncbi:MAG: hypothetical protein IJ677_02895 [Alphaproteobacteria bacterium]|nr:hypothetical protein [Alphaproteobacteria bacterium]